MDEEAVLKICQQNRFYMIARYRRQFVTQRVFNRYLQPFYRYFPQFVTKEFLIRKYETGEFVSAFANMYPYEILNEVIKTRPYIIADIDDPDIVAKLFAENPNLANYREFKKINTQIKYRMTNPTMTTHQINQV